MKPVIIQHIIRTTRQRLQQFRLPEPTGSTEPKRKDRTGSILMMFLVAVIILAVILS